jgi:hypothetical protein
MAQVEMRLLGEVDCAPSSHDLFSNRHEVTAHVL